MATVLTTGDNKKVTVPNGTVWGSAITNFNALAMDPLGHVAGTASSVLGFMQTLGGGILGALIGAGFDGTLRLWPEGQGPLTLAEFGLPLNALVALPDGVLALGGADGMLRLVAPDGGLREVQASPRPIVMFSQDASDVTMRSAVRAGVACYVVDGLRAERLQPLLQLARVRFEAWQALRDDMLRARLELQEHKLIEQAKRRLMKVEKLSEEAAYQALRREAMTQRKRVVDVARRLLEVPR